MKSENMVESHNFSKLGTKESISSNIKSYPLELQPWKLVLKKEIKKSRVSRKAMKEITLYF